MEISDEVCEKTSDGVFEKVCAEVCVRFYELFDWKGERVCESACESVCEIGCESVLTCL